MNELQTMAEAPRDGAGVRRPWEDHSKTLVDVVSRTSDDYVDLANGKKARAQPTAGSKRRRGRKSKAELLSLERNAMIAKGAGLARYLASK